MRACSSATCASSCSLVRFPAIDALAFSFVPSPATTDRSTRPSAAHALTDSGSSPSTAATLRRTNLATVEWSGCRPPQMTRAPTSSNVAISISRADFRPRQ